MVTFSGFFGGSGLNEDTNSSGALIGTSRFTGVLGFLGGTGFSCVACSNSGTPGSSSVVVFSGVFGGTGLNELQDTNGSIIAGLS